MADHHHLWRTVSEHPTSEGRLAYRTCSCGRWRVVLDPSAAPAAGSWVLAERRTRRTLRAVPDRPAGL